MYPDLDPFFCQYNEQFMQEGMQNFSMGKLDQIAGNVSSVMEANAVFEGGGIRGLAHVGALKVAEEQGYRWQHVAGTSAGAIIAALVAAGYTADELYQIMKTFDFKRFMDTPDSLLFPLFRVVKLLTKGGLHSGAYIETFMRERLREKKKETFGDLLIPGQEQNPDPFLRYRLTVIASDITTGRMIRLPQDAHLYGIEPNDLEVARAIRMSASFPFFFVPVPLRHRDGFDCRIVDGGLLSGLPLFLFEHLGVPPDIPTFGFSVSDHSPPRLEGKHQKSGIISLLTSLLTTMLNAHDKVSFDNATYVRTISIPTDGVGMIQFTLTPGEAEQLYVNGQKAAEAFFSTWDFEAYRATYGSGAASVSRLEQLHKAMKAQAAQQTLSGLADLSNEVQDVARVLLEQGECTLSQIITTSGLDEATAIKALTELLEREFIRSSEMNGVYRYKIVLLSRRRRRFSPDINF